MNNIFFLRHAKTLNNDLCIISGQSDSNIISEDYLKIDFNYFDKIYCSPSLRCIDTLDILNCMPFSICNVLYDKALLERNMGHLEGMLKIDGLSKYPDLFTNGSFDVFKTPPQGESYKTFKNRVYCFYNDCLNTNDQLNILVCSHNQTLKLLRLFILNKKVTHETWLEHSFKNGEIEKIR